MISIDQYAYISKLKNKDPLQKIFFAVITLFVCLWSNVIPISIAIILIMAWSTIYIGGTPLSFFLKLMLLPMSFLIVGVLTLAFNVASNKEIFIFSVPFFGSYLGTSKTGLIESVNLLFKALGAVSCLYFLALSTPIVKLLSALTKLKVPRLIVELMSLIYRFIFILLGTAETMFTAQNSRLGYITISTRFRSMGALISTLFIRAYKRADDIYCCLEARGYDGELNMVEEPVEKVPYGYVIAAGIDILLIGASLLWKAYEGGNVL